ncbi:probable basic-leucine zipper transcription factor Q [Drosophila ficusphila]|uniref:probable basic-leucine zipper transcription factor Q n=1 Tax=Drosophila ficusphila TaxID=30025 RepID=UPI0007E78288|nr:probable basic-leucine zipper transcription factor Q [Drosophila ficusphila]
MDDVPVKIVERYKPPPDVFHLPQATLNRLSQFREDFYAEHPDYQYDGQLERAVLSQAHRWRQVRRQQRQERSSRQERRKQERQRALEAKQKEMLGAVDYPSTDDLSSDEEEQQEGKDLAQKEEEQAPPATSESRDSSHEPKSIGVCNFHNILQPTILSATPVASPQTLHKRNSSLNYADFEYNMNSTPFDNIELKTINDLDILAQVLHQTQLEERRDQQQQQLDQPQRDDHSREEQPHQEVPAPVELTMTTLAETKATLDSVNFHVHCDDDEGRSETSNIPATPLYQTPMYSSTAQQQLHKPEHFQVYHMQGFSQHSPHTQPYQQSNNYYVNGFGTPIHLLAPPAPSSVLTLSQAEDEVATKSRSVPDILRELKTELQQAENRRNRLHSHNEEHQPKMEVAVDRNSFRDLAGPAQKLAQRISTMGFPLERVAKVVSLCGIDDKKIIEHLIPLGELMDLGFDESKISAALLKFNNNKDKALDYLIN